MLSGPGPKTNLCRDIVITLTESSFCYAIRKVMFLMQYFSMWVSSKHYAI